MKMDMQSDRNTDSPLVIEGFTVLQVKGNEKSKEPLFLYLKPHSSNIKSAVWQEGKTLQVFNVPPYCNEENLKLIFDFSEIVSVHLQDKPTFVPETPLPFLQTTTKQNYKVAYVVFKHLEGVKKACDLSYNQVRLLSNQDVPLCNAGIGAFIKEYSDAVLDPVALEKAANDYLTEYYKKQDKQEEVAKSMEGVPDEDGFIKVTRRGKFKGIRRTEQSDKRGRERHHRRREKLGMSDFYRFQIRDTKRQHIADLQKKFEEDKKRVQEMKSARKFKPMR